MQQSLNSILFSLKYSKLPSMYNNVREHVLFSSMPHIKLIMRISAIEFRVSLELSSGTGSDS